MYSMTLVVFPPPPSPPPGCATSGIRVRVGPEEKKKEQEKEKKTTGLQGVRHPTECHVRVGSNIVIIRPEVRISVKRDLIHTKET